MTYQITKLKGIFWYILFHSVKAILYAGQGNIAIDEIKSENSKVLL